MSFVFFISLLDPPLLHLLTGYNYLCVGLFPCGECLPFISRASGGERK
jgi:hypothetical protein